MFEFWLRYWWVPVLRGVAAILLGVFAFVWPLAAITALVLVFGAVALADGILAIAAAIAGRKLASDWWVLLLGGILGVGVGIFTVVHPGITAAALVILVAVWAIGLGVLQIVSAFRLRHVIPGEWWLAIGGVLGVVFGVLLVRYPLGGELAMVWLIGLFALVWGAMQMIAGFDLRRLTRHATA